MAGTEPLLIFGAGGHFSVVLDIAQHISDLSLAGIVAPPDSTLSNGPGYPTFTDDNWQDSGCTQGLVAIADNAVRERVVEKIMASCPSFHFLSLVHPSATVSPAAQIGAGSVVMAGSVINPNAVIGEHTIINTGAIVEHDCLLGDYASIAPGVVLGGATRVGSHAALSIGATVLHGKQIGDNSVIGAGAVVTKDVEANVVAYGVPCHSVRKRSKGDKYL
jgi:sugar O-acyltransferase (sialic acid O-acetyltransferase NeuD family)